MGSTTETPCRKGLTAAGFLRGAADYSTFSISPSVAPVDHRTGDAESWRWHEFTLTAYHFGGQTLYHGGLLVEGWVVNVVLDAAYRSMKSKRWEEIPL